MGSGDAIVKVSGRDIEDAGLGGLFAKVNEAMDAVQFGPIAHLSAYLYCEGKSDLVVGCLITEPIRGVRCAPMEGDVEGGRAIPCTVGVCRIWVDSRWRRRGIAMRLLHCIRECDHCSSANCIPSRCCVAKESIAFSQLTSAGLQLARSFCRAGVGTTCTVYAGGPSEDGGGGGLGQQSARLA